MGFNKTLLFVDDEKEILEILIDLFSDEGYRLHTATKASEALAISKNHSVDFVLSDLRLPDASGKDLLEQIQADHPRAVRVLTSGYLDVRFGHVTEDKKSGTFYVSKPWDLFSLKNLVAEKVG